MHVIATALPNVLIFEPRVFADERGWFMESYNQAVFEKAVGHAAPFVQDNHSCSKRGVLRGLHYQLPPYAQGKLVRATQGRVWDVAVDIRKSSATFGKWVGVELSAENRRQLWIPPGFAHGFITLSETSEFMYKTTAPYNKESEGAIAWNDPQLAIQWPEIAAMAVILAEKDAAAPRLTDARLFT
ncbi:dTDP-4-dehydrorhamnose 3,5-epimerase [Janthinobacterium sp. 17J80-10]|uniref:dTDP-4-dehydrorhamnose 3,5-epimerase n=1 Tax=Janthinobacterium sp. 17J80-10 TaxID=2497863 RepID=UPI0010058895|nr:dTDP-4-dehydrorhamnose 3,5-epimerase [Janthinobacterium sp. 17J80-10]QAU35567.1 dTDP-4-dehydrorhamnose 3,5-epimerase [Janthinobacterium sp. 17J80-10]